MQCPECFNEVNSNQAFCQHCGKKLTYGSDYFDTYSGNSPTTGNNVGKPNRAIGKSPAIALILSLLIVGLGQFYNGDNKKGAIMLGAAIVAGIISAGILWFAIGIWSAVDAYQVANGEGEFWT